MRLRYAPLAIRDLAGIASYIRAYDPSAAVRVGSEIRRCAAMLSDHPQAGRSIGRGLRRYAVPRLPYLIVYRVDEAAAEVAVITIRHAARRPFV